MLSHFTCYQLLLGPSHSLRIEVVFYRDNVRAELILALEYLIICVNDAGISYDIKGLDKVTFDINSEFHDGMWTVYMMIFSFSFIVLPWVSFRQFYFLLFRGIGNYSKISPVLIREETCG